MSDSLNVSKNLSLSEEWEVSPPERPVETKKKTKTNKNTKTNTMSEEWEVSSPQRPVESFSCVGIKEVRPRFG